MVRQRSLYLILTIVGVGLVVTANRFVFHGVLEDAAYRAAARPLQFIEGKLADRRLTKVIRERDELLGVIVRAEALERENAALRKQLGVLPRAARPPIIGRVYGFQRTPLLSTMLIDRGTGDGVSSGMVVVAPGNILVGTIDETFSHTSRVILVDDPRLVASVRLLGADLIAESKGVFQGAAAINLISHTDRVEVGTVVVTSGLDAFPEGLPVGKITRAERGAHSLFQDVEARLLFDPTQSPTIFIILP